MKIAFVDNIGVYGGLSRFSYMLCKGLALADTSIRIDYYTHANNLKRTPELLSLPENVQIKVLRSTVPGWKQRYSFLLNAYNKGLRTIKLNKYQYVRDESSDTQAELEERLTNGYDLAFFPVAHMMRKPNLSIPMVGTIHDFNWKYFFGRQIFPLDFVKEMDQSILDWLNNTHTACSSYDVIAEANKLYPGLKRYPEAIHIAPVVFSENVTEEQSKQALKELGIDYPYIIFPGNFFPHKNHLNLFAAFHLLKQRKGFEDIKLILTGANSDQIAYGIAEKCGAQIVTENSYNKNYNIRGLGYQPNHVLEALVRNARLLVSPSLYEAICTPAMDAWFFGTPTAISNIAPFTEHEQVLGVRSAYFDPMNIENIADTIEGYLNDPVKAKQDGAISKENILKYSWDTVAHKYLNLFHQAINEKK